MRTAYKCRAYPTSEQATMLARTFGCVRVVWNRTLAWNHERYYSEGLQTPFAETNAHLTAMKREPELEWLNEVSSVPLQQVLRHQSVAFTNFFAGRAKYPRFKSRSHRQSASYTRSAFRMKAGELWLAKTAAPLSFVWSWPDVDVTSLNPTTVTISRDPEGRHFVSFSVDVDDAEPMPTTGIMLGIDLGLKDFAVTSAGDKIAHPQHMEKREIRLKRYQRQMARKKKGSANRARAKVKVARCHAKVADARRDFLHQQSTRLIREADVIVVENLAVGNMVKNRSLAKSISRTGWAEFRSMLAYKCERYGRTLIVVDRWFPSSKTCSGCGYLLAELSLSTRKWKCPGCGTLHDRDINAAKNILAAGLAVTACGDGVRRQGATLSQPSVKQETSRVTAE